MAVPDSVPDIFGNINGLRSYLRTLGITSPGTVMGIWKRYLKWLDGGSGGHAVIDQLAIELAEYDDPWTFKTPTQSLDLRRHARENDECS
jgi:hypothetical protein